MPTAKKKKRTKKTTRTQSSHKASVRKVGYRHSVIFSDNVLMILAFFFALVGLVMIMVMKRQNDEFDAYVRKQQTQTQQQYVTPVHSVETPMSE
ncbi:MAG: hypothetical protein ABI758_02615 [Candidatus Woesebacteria bacterium]